MSAIRSSSVRALRQLSAHSHQTRQLHITGPATYPSRLLTSENPSRSKDHKSARSEAAKRGKEETDSASINTRTLTTAHAPVRPQATSPSAPRKSTREINTSRTLKAPKDTSTIDFAFLPATPSPVPMDNVNMRVPLVPENYTPDRSGAHAVLEPDYDTIFRSQVITAAGEETHVTAPSAMSEVHDNTSVGIDYTALAKSMEDRVSDVAGRARETQGTVRRLWDGVVDDILGPKRSMA